MTSLPSLRSSTPFFRATSSAVLIAALATGCSDTSEGAPTPAPTSSSTGTTPSASSSPADNTSPIHVAKYYEKHPDEAPDSVRKSQVIIDEKLLGPRTLRGLDLTGYQNVTLFLTCGSEIAYQIALGTAQDPNKNVSGGGSCGGGNLNSFTVPVQEKGPFTQITAKMPSDATYYLTVYGEPPNAPL